MYSIALHYLNTILSLSSILSIIHLKLVGIDIGIPKYLYNVPNYKFPFDFCLDSSALSV